MYGRGGAVRGRITVELLGFLRTGDFGPLRWGMSRAELEALFGPAPITGGGTRNDPRPVIHKYGDFEFYVHPGSDRLFAIHCDSVAGGALAGGRAFHLDAGPFHWGAHIGEIGDELRAAGVLWARKPSTDASVDLWETEGGVSLGFEAGEDTEGADGLCLISRWNHGILPPVEPTRTVSLVLPEPLVGRLKVEAARSCTSLAGLCAAMIEERAAEMPGPETQ